MQKHVKDIFIFKYLGFHLKQFNPYILKKNLVNPSLTHKNQKHSMKQLESTQSQYAMRKLATIDLNCRLSQIKSGYHTRLQTGAQSKVKLSQKKIRPLYPFFFQEFHLINFDVILSVLFSLQAGWSKAHASKGKSALTDYIHQYIWYFKHSFYLGREGGRNKLASSIYKMGLGWLCL